MGTALRLWQPHWGSLAPCRTLVQCQGEVVPPEGHHAQPRARSGSYLALPGSSALTALTGSSIHRALQVHRLCSRSTSSPLRDGGCGWYLQPWLPGCCWCCCGLVSQSLGEPSQDMGAAWATPLVQRPPGMPEVRQVSPTMHSPALRTYNQVRTARKESAKKNKITKMWGVSKSRGGTGDRRPPGALPGSDLGL